MDNKLLAEQLVKDCQKKGADAAEVYIEYRRKLKVKVRNGEIETVEEASERGASFRVFVKGRMAFSSCNVLQEASLENAIARSIDFAKSTTADKNNVLPEDNITHHIAGLYDPNLATIPLKTKVDLALKTEKLAMKDPRITKSAGGGYAEGEREVFLANSHGLSKTYQTSSCYFGVNVVAEKGDQKFPGGEGCGRRSYSDLKPAQEIADKAAQYAIELIDPKKVKTQKAAVIFTPDVAYAILEGILGAIHGEHVLQGASFLAKKLQQKIASDLVTIYDDGTLPKGLASCPFDGEGVSTQRRLIIGKGYLKGFLYNCAVGKRAGLKSTGNASRGGFASLPEIGPHNFYMQAGKTKPEEIIAATKVGLLLRDVTGYGINPVNGQFSGGASGLWIENGKIAFPVRGLTIAGNADEMLHGIDMVGTDLDQSRTITTPTFRIKQMQIGGE